MKRKRIAIIGGGVAGLSAAFLLSKEHDVTIFEAGETLGGHAHAETLTDEKGASFNVDTAFLIFNDRTYSNFLKFIQALGVDDRSIPAEMSSCFSDVDRDFHYTLGNGLKPFLASPSSFLNGKLPRIIFDLLQFRKRASRDLELKTDLSSVDAQTYLAPYSDVFVENFVYPLTAAIWSLPAKQMREYPISALLRYFDNHQLLKGASDRRWRTFRGSSRIYVDAFAKNFKGKVHLGSRVKSVQRVSTGVEIHLSDESLVFDEVVMATHADVSLNLLANPTHDERRLLSAWTYQDNPVTLHLDSVALHDDPRLWGSWNMTRKSGEYNISYYLNRLQSLKSDRPVILTLGECSAADSLVVKNFIYRHPVFTDQSVATQRELDSLNGIDRIHFCGSYFGYGFHEDAVKSATAVAKNFGISWWNPGFNSGKNRCQ